MSMPISSSRDLNHATTRDATANRHSRRRTIASATIALLLACAPSTLHAAINTVFDVVPVDPIDNVDVIVGDIGLGYLTIDQGSVLLSNEVIIGNEAEAIGFATVIDFISEWSTLDMTVGEEGIGRLEVLDGALVDVDFDGGIGDLVIGRDAGSNGEVFVSGFQTILSMGDDTTVGLNGIGTLRISSEAFVDATNNPGSPGDVFTVGASGRVELGHGWLRTGTLINNGEIVGEGRIDSAAAVQNNGRIEVVSGERLVIDDVGGVDNRGEIAVFGGEVDFRDAATNHAGSEVTLLSGIVHFPQLAQAAGFTNSGVLATTGGVNDVYGDVLNAAAGTIVVAGDSTAVFHDDVTNQGGTIEVFPGSTSLFLSDLAMGAGSLLSVRLAGTDDQTGIGEVEVSGSAALVGDLAIALDDGFVPTAGDMFQVLTAAGGVTGMLDLASAPSLPGGLSWELGVIDESLVLSVVGAALAGDYNGNGVVDAADYTVWRDTLGQTGGDLAADGNGNGEIDSADYGVWKSNFGQSAGAAAGASTVPEPSAFVLLSIGAIVVALQRPVLARTGAREVF